MAHSLSRRDYQSLAELRYRIRRYLHFSEQAAQKSGLEARQYQLMLALKGMPAGIRPRILELAERLQIKHHSTVALVDRLAKGGYVLRQPSQQDRREVHLILTAKGDQVLAQLALHHWNELRAQGPELLGALEKVLSQNRSYYKKSIYKKSIAVKSAKFPKKVKP